MSALLEADFRAALAHTLTGLPTLDGLGPATSGKVRESWLLPDRRRLLVTTDRVSAFDRVLGTIPFKGQVLNLLSAWWFERTRHIVPNHLISVPDPNAMIVRDAIPLPIEVVVRGFITGVTSTSLWTLYQDGHPNPYGHTLPPGLHKDDRLPHPIITPTTKALAGHHDEPITATALIERGLVSPTLWAQIESKTLALFAEGQRVAEAQGLLLVDTKYELGLIDGELTVIDEVHTPDSSRYWLRDSWLDRTPDRPPAHLDKELLRQGLVAMGYRGDGPPPPLPDDLRITLAQRYIDLYERLTGLTFTPPSEPASSRLPIAIATAA